MFFDLVLVLAAIAAVLAAFAALNLLMVRLIERKVPPLGRFLTVDGLRLHVVDSGPAQGQGQSQGQAQAEAPPLVFIHGLLAQLNHFTYALAQKFPERRVVLIDRPGCGFSENAPDQSFAAQAALIDKALDQLGVTAPVLVGHSLGGAVALAMALKNPEKISGLALIAPLTHLVSAPPKAFRSLLMRSRWFLALGAWTLGPWLTLARGKQTIDIVFGPEAMPADFGLRGGGALGFRPRALLAAGEDIVTQPHDLPRMLLRYGGLEMPVGVLFGASDRVLDPAYQGAGFCQSAPNAEFVQIPGGHMLPVTAPEACENFIRKILARAH